MPQGRLPAVSRGDVALDHTLGLSMVGAREGESRRKAGEKFRRARGLLGRRIPSPDRQGEGAGPVVGSGTQRHRLGRALPGCPVLGGSAVPQGGGRRPQAAGETGREGGCAQSARTHGTAASKTPQPLLRFPGSLPSSQRSGPGCPQPAVAAPTGLSPPRDCPRHSSRCSPSPPSGKPTGSPRAHPTHGQHRRSVFSRPVAKAPPGSTGGDWLLRGAEDAAAPRQHEDDS